MTGTCLEQSNDDLCICLVIAYITSLDDSYFSNQICVVLFFQTELVNF